MKIVELRADNFKRLRAVEIRPGAGVQVISGRNAQGKSSVLDAVWAALGGKSASPDRPIRDGEKTARVTVDLGDYIVTRRWTADDKSTLVVESKDGAQYKSPQAMLDGLLGGLSFDPLAFMRSPSAKQAETLRQIAGVDTRALDSRRDEAYSSRTEAARVLKAQQANLGAMPEVEAPEHPVHVASLMDAIQNAEAELRRRDAVRARAKHLESEVDTIMAQIADLQAKAEAKNDERRRGDETVAAFNPPPDVAALREQVRNADEVNQRVRAKSDRAAQIGLVAKSADAVQKLNAEIDLVDAQRTSLLSVAKFPVPGLSVDGDSPTYKGLPLAQASGAEQLRVSLAIASALNAKLRVALVRDGSLLDEDGLATVATWAEEQGLQVLLERVAKKGETVGIVIEDGAVSAIEEAADPFPLSGAE